MKKINANFDHINQNVLMSDYVEEQSSKIVNVEETQFEKLVIQIICSNFGHMKYALSTFGCVENIGVRVLFVNK